MTERWAILMQAGDGAAVASLRTRTGLAVCEAPSALWLCGDGADEALERELKKLPAVQRYTIDADDRLVPLGGLVPAGVLPGGPWQAIEQWSTLKPQTASLPGEVPSRIALRLVRTDRMADPGLLVTSMECWQDFVRTAPQVRLNKLSFALDEAGRVAVRGQPLPPIPGTRYVEDEGIAVPCGFTIAPAVGSAVLRHLLRLAAGDCAVFQPDGACEAIPAAAFVRATRSAVRLSTRGLQHG